MAETVDIDKLVGELDSGPKLEDLDDIFKTEPVKAPEVKKAEGRQGLLSSGLTPEQEQLATGGAGAMLGMLASPAARAMIPPAEERTAAGIRAVQQRAALERTLEELLNRQLTSRAGPPITVAPPTPPAAMGAMPSELDLIQHAVARDQPTSSLARERGQQMLTKSTYEAGRAQKDLIEDLFRRNLAPQNLDELSARLGPTVPASGESRVLTTQAGAFDVEQARLAELERQRRAAEIQQRLQQAQQTRLQQQQTAAALAQASEQAAARQRAVGQVAAQVEGATPGPLSRVAGAVARPLGGALGGAGAGMSIYEAIQRYKEGDRSGAVIAALGGLSGIASMIPGLGLAGTAVGLGTLPAQYINDVLKGRTQATVPTQFDPMGNPLQ